MAEKLRMQSSDIIEENISFIETRFPNAIVEAYDDEGKLVKKVDFEILKQELSHVLLSDKQERYQMTWPDKKKSILLANASINGTLRPLIHKSVNFDCTRNIYIEGDNLDVLKLLRETYLNKIKMIYIDPPYNTGSDLVYEDDFKESTDAYLTRSGQFDEQGNKLVANTDSNGRFHTDWLNMIYPRLKIAKDLLSEEGIILIHIDENEFVNLIKICDEIFGGNNYIENFIWIKNSTKNLSKTTSTNHEYVVCYCKNREILENTGLLRTKKPGLDEVLEILEKANKYKWSFELTEEKLKEFYKTRPELKGISNYDRVDWGPAECEAQMRYQVYTLSDASAPKSTGRAAMYEVIHPATGRPCKCPSTGWRFTRSTMEQHIKNNLIYFYEDETHVPRFKRYLDTVTTEVVKSTFEDFSEGKKDLLKLFDNRCPFDNPKPVSVAKRFIELLTDGDTVLDFFSGSGTTAHAVFEVNMNKNTNINFICVQLPEICESKSEAFDMGFRYITDISEERILRAGNKLQSENGVLASTIDTGFRVLKLDSSNMKDVYYNPKEIVHSLLDEDIDNVKEDRTSLDLLFQVMLELGVELSAKIEEKQVGDSTIYIVNESYFVACFDKDIDDEVVKTMANIKPVYIVLRDASFSNDSANINCEQTIKIISPSTELKVI